ncbi:MAG: HEAT repeat domain-containing protein, partial [Burkholderiales bacterium]
AAWALGEIKSPEAVPALIQVLKDSDEGVRENTVRALGEINSSDAVPALMEAVKDLANTPAVRRAAAWALGEIKSPEAVPALILALKDPDNDSEVRRDAASILGELGFPKAVLALLEALKDPDDSIRMSSARVLAKFRSPEVEVGLRSVLNDGYFLVREAACRGLLNAHSADYERRFRDEGLDWLGVLDELLLEPFGAGLLRAMSLVSTSNSRFRTRALGMAFRAQPAFSSSVRLALDQARTIWQSPEAKIYDPFLNPYVLAMTSRWLLNDGEYDLALQSAQEGLEKVAREEIALAIVLNWTKIQALAEIKQDRLALAGIKHIQKELLPRLTRLERRGSRLLFTAQTFFLEGFSHDRAGRTKEASAAYSAADKAVGEDANLAEAFTADPSDSMDEEVADFQRVLHGF